MPRARKEPAIIARQRCPTCGSLLASNARVPFADPGGCDILLQRFAGRGRIENIRALSYLDDGPFETAYRFAWIHRLRLVLRILTLRVRASSVSPIRYGASGPSRSEELTATSAPRYHAGQFRVHRFDGGGSG